MLNELLKLPNEPLIKQDSDNPAVILHVGGRSLQLTSSQLSQAWTWIDNENSLEPPQSLSHVNHDEWAAIAFLLADVKLEQSQATLH
jgi:hypothetical protein